MSNEAPPKTPPDRPNRSLKLMLQIGIVFAVCLAGEILSKLLPVAIPGSIISMLVLFALLAAKVVKVDHIRQKADFLLQNMAFFFIPAGIGIIADFDAIKDSIAPLLAVILITSVLTFGAAALTVRAVLAAQKGLRRTRVARLRRERKALNG